MNFRIFLFSVSAFFPFRLYLSLSRSMCCYSYSMLICKPSGLLPRPFFTAFCLPFSGNLFGLLFPLFLRCPRMHRTRPYWARMDIPSNGFANSKNSPRSGGRSIVYPSHLVPYEFSKTQDKICSNVCSTLVLAFNFRNILTALFSP